MSKASRMRICWIPGGSPTSKKKKRKAGASGSALLDSAWLNHDAISQGHKQLSGDKVREGGAKVTSRGVSKSPLPKGPSSGVVIQKRSGSQPNNKKQPQIEYSGKGKRVDVVSLSRDFIEAAKVNRDPKLVRVPTEQLLLDLRTAVATAEFHLLTVPSFFGKIQTRCVELEHKYVETQG